MKLDKAISTLKEFNHWRRGAYIPMPDPKVIGLAIDIVVKHHEAMHELEVKVKQVDNKIEKRWDALSNKYPYPHKDCDIGCYSNCTKGDSQKPDCIKENYINNTMRIIESYCQGKYHLEFDLPDLNKIAEEINEMYENN